jgi:hypothetical protein
MARTTLEIEFSPTAGDDTLQLELDDELNAGATSFPPGGEVWLRAITEGAICARQATRGAVRIEGTQKVFEHEEELVFEDENSATLTYPAHEVITTDWLGVGLGTVSVSGRNVKAGQSGHAILHIRYRVKYALLRLHGVEKEGPVLVWAEDEYGRKGTLQVSFTAEGGQQEVFLTVKDYCTDLPVAGASVYLDGQFKGTTDNYGRISLGKLIRGRSYGLKITAPGYKDSDTDALANDSFTVE